MRVDGQVRGRDFAVEFASRVVVRPLPLVWHPRRRLRHRLLSATVGATMPAIDPHQTALLFCKFSVPLPP